MINQPKKTSLADLVADFLALKNSDHRKRASAARNHNIDPQSSHGIDHEIDRMRWMEFYIESRQAGFAFIPHTMNESITSVRWRFEEPFQFTRDKPFDSTKDYPPLTVFLRTNTKDLLQRLNRCLVEHLIEPKLILNKAVAERSDVPIDGFDFVIREMTYMFTLGGAWFDIGDGVRYFSRDLGKRDWKTGSHPLGMRMGEEYALPDGRIIIDVMTGMS